VFVTRNRRTKQSWAVVNAVNSSLQSRESTAPLTERKNAAERTAVPGLAAAATSPADQGHEMVAAVGTK
jgi:hypothetical protein